MAGSRFTIGTIISATSSAAFFIGSAIYYACAAIAHSTEKENHNSNAEITAVIIGSVFFVGGVLCAITSCCVSRDNSEYNVPLNGDITENV